VLRLNIALISLSNFCERCEAEEGGGVHREGEERSMAGTDLRVEEFDDSPIL
jgi:hypothetical protein